MTKAYRSNLTWEQWELIANVFPEAKPGGRPRKLALLAVVNAILYVLCEGCTWRGLPGDFPAWSTVYGYFWRWSKDGTWLKVHDQLYRWVRVDALRAPSPSEAAVDSQSVETATMISIDVGYDAGKKIHGRKRHLRVDMLGLVLRVLVTAASVPERVRVSVPQGRSEKSSPTSSRYRQSGKTVKRYLDGRRIPRRRIYALGDRHVSVDC